MARDICHAAKHGDLTWDETKAEKHGPTLATLEYQSGTAGDDNQSDVVWAVSLLGVKHDVVFVMRNAIADWSRFLDQRKV